MTIPVDPTLAIPLAVLLHVPPVVASLNVLDEPMHNDGFPEIRPGPVTVTVVVGDVAVNVAAPQPLANTSQYTVLPLARVVVVNGLPVAVGVPLTNHW